MRLWSIFNATLTETQENQSDMEVVDDQTYYKTIFFSFVISFISLEFKNNRGLLLPQQLKLNRKKIRTFRWRLELAISWHFTLHLNTWFDGYVLCAHAFTWLISVINRTIRWLLNERSQKPTIMFFFLSFFFPRAIDVMQSGMNCVHFVKMRIIDDSMHNASNFNVSIFWSIDLLTITKCMKNLPTKQPFDRWKWPR